MANMILSAKVSAVGASAEFPSRFLFADCQSRKRQYRDGGFNNLKSTSASIAPDGLKRELGRSAGAVTSKIHLLANIEKMPIDFCLSPGRTSDTKIGARLIERNLGKIKSLLGDKAYNTNHIRSLLVGVGANVCIPPKYNSKISSIAMESSTQNVRPEK